MPNLVRPCGVPLVDRTVRVQAALPGEKRGMVIMTGVSGFVNPRFWVGVSILGRSVAEALLLTCTCLQGERLSLIGHGNRRHAPRVPVIARDEVAFQYGEQADKEKKHERSPRCFHYGV